MRFRLYPTPEQEVVLVDHCAHARFVWNLALEQANLYRPNLGSTPDHAERCRQLTEARAEFEWLRNGIAQVQQQALRDFDQAMRNWWGGSHQRPTWRKKGRHEGFRLVQVQFRKLNRRWGEVLVPKLGSVRFRLTRAIPSGVRSARITRDSSGRWHVAFAVRPEPLDGPQDGSIVGIDRGVTVTLALSDGTMFHAPEPLSLRGAARQVSRAKRGSNRRQRAKQRVARAYACDTDRRKDFVEKSSTTIAKNFDLIRIEDLKIRNMVRSAKGTREKPGTNVRQKAGLNRSILAQRWGMIAKRLADKAPGRVEKVNPAFTSCRCSECKHVDPKSRESQASFRCTACGYSANADLNAAINIAAGHAVTGRGGLVLSDLPVSRQPQLVA